MKKCKCEKIIKNFEKGITPTLLDFDCQDGNFINNDFQEWLTCPKCGTRYTLTYTATSLEKQD